MSQEYTIRNTCPCGSPTCRLNDIGSSYAMAGGAPGYGGSNASAYAGGGMSYSSAITNTVPGTDFMRMAVDVGALPYGSVTFREEKVWVSRQELLRQGKWIPEYQDGEWQMRMKQVFPLPEYSKVEEVSLYEPEKPKRVNKADEVIKRIKDRRRKRKEELNKKPDESAKWYPGRTMDNIMDYLLKEDLKKAFPPIYIA